jgi:hypothetical protein
MTKYYENCLKEGLEYQDFVMETLFNDLGIPLTNYSSEKYQYSVGENKQGIEIKYQSKMSEYNSIYIEVAEKTNKDNASYVDSGIFRNDNCWLFVTGDYKTIYIFSKKCLVSLYESGKYEIKEIANKTSKGFVLKGSDIENYAIKKINVTEVK